MMKIVAGDAVLLGDTNITLTDADELFTLGTLNGVKTIGGNGREQLQLIFLIHYKYC